MIAPAVMSDEVLIPLGWLRQQAASAGDRPVDPSPDEPRLFTLREIANRYGRSVSTARQWAEAGLLPGAFKLRGRAWRVPTSAVATFDALQGHQTREAPTAGTVTLRPGQSVGDWRKRRSAR
jgi:hypothetical protein